MMQTSDTINGKTPEEIKKGLEYHYVTRRCAECPYTADTEFKKTCFQLLSADALAYIQQLESRLVQAECERDAAVADFTRYVNFGGRECDLCRDIDTVCTDCEWVWRGVKTNDN